MRNQRDSIPCYFDLYHTCGETCNIGNVRWFNYLRPVKLKLKSLSRWVNFEILLNRPQRSVECSLFKPAYESHILVVLCRVNQPRWNLLRHYFHIRVDIFLKKGSSINKSSCPRIKIIMLMMSFDDKSEIEKRSEIPNSYLDFIENCIQVPTKLASVSKYYAA